MFLTGIFIISFVCGIALCAQPADAADATTRVEAAHDGMQADRYGPSGVIVPKEQAPRTGEGMEVVRLDGLNILVPRGMRVRKEGSQIIFEDIGEYLGRRLQSIENRLLDLEGARADLERAIRAIEKMVTETRPLVSPDTEDEGGYQ